MLEKFLKNKALYYDKIDYDRMPNTYNKIKNKINLPKIIHIIGTNGKGTTGRFLATALYKNGYKTGHYTSPHILNFNERIWLNGNNVQTNILDNAHQKLLSLLGNDIANKLSYFEYTTLLSIIVYQDCDYIVLEAGLGGEYDATSVFPNILTLVTPIDIDHEAFLGDTIKDIASTKLNAIKRKAIFAKQKHQEIYNIAHEKNINFLYHDTLLDEDDLVNINKVAQDNNLAPYLIDNLMVSISALKELGIKYTIKDFKDSKLFGRISYISNNIIVDVGHNKLASTSIYNTLKNDKYILIYNTYKDKNYKEILSILKPIIKHIELIEVKDNRIEDKYILENTIKTLSINYKNFTDIKDTEKYLVFGSFSVVEAFLKVYNG